MEGGAVGHNFERDPPRDHPCQVCFNLVLPFWGLPGTYFNFLKFLFFIYLFFVFVNCSYIAMSSLTYIPGFSVKFFFQSIYTDYAN
jgi:hypothetical protein